MRIGEKIPWLGWISQKRLPNFRLRVKHIAQIGEDCVGRDGEPVAHRLPVERSLRLQIVSDL